MSAGRGPGTGRGSAGRGVSRVSGGAGARPGAAGRSGVRPAAAIAGRPARAGGAPRPTRTRRLVALGVIAVVLTVLLAPAIRSYVAQRRQIDLLTTQVADQRAQVGDLQRERDGWDDPAYVKAQARDRLKFVMPGDRAYTVIDPAPTPARVSTKARTGVPAVAADRAWFGNLWRSAQIAGAPPAAR